MSQTPREPRDRGVQTRNLSNQEGRPPAQQGRPPAGRPAQPNGPRRVNNSNYYAPPPRRDPFPLIMSGIIGALVVGLMVVIYLLTTRNNTPVPTVAINPTVPANSAAPTAMVVNPVGAQSGEVPAPRMELKDFMALYNDPDPAKRPLVVDVRPKDAYNEGHIRGAVSIPEAEVDARIAEFPKDRLIVAYCQ